MSKFDVTTVGGRLRAARNAAGMQQKALAVEIGVGAAMICQIESGMTRLPVERAAAIADVLGVSLDWLFRGVGPGPSSIDVGQPTGPGAVVGSAG